MRKAVLAVVFALLVSSGTALSFGSFASDQDVQVAGNSASFTISVFNLADESVKLKIDSSGAEDTEVIHPSSMTLEPATVTSNPERGGNWFLMADGRYVEVEEIPVEHFRGGSGSSQYSFDISLTASPLDSSSDSSSQKIAQTRSYSFDVEYVGTPETSSDTGGTGSVDDEASQDSSFSDTVSQNLPDLGDVGGSIERVFEGGNTNSQDNNQGSSENQESSGESGPENDAGSEANSKTKSESEESTSTSKEEAGTASQNQSGLTGNFAGGANGVTVVLLVALSMSALYLFKVM